MKTITVPTNDQLNDQSRTILEKVKAKIGMVPNLYATIGYSSSALKGMLDFEAEIAHDVIFSPKEREAINLIVSEVNQCEYCLAAHTALAKMRGFTEEETILIRKAIFPDARLNTVILLAESVAVNKGKAEEKFVTAFFEAGYNEKALMDLLALIALRTFTNYVFSVTAIPIDFPEAPAI